MDAACDDTLWHGTQLAPTSKSSPTKPSMGERMGGGLRTEPKKALAKPVVCREVVLTTNAGCRSIVAAVFARMGAPSTKAYCRCRSMSTETT